MQGLHLTADLHDCQCDRRWLTDAARLLAHCERTVVQAGLRAVARLAHTFPPVDGRPAGVTATVLLAESHLCVHTWPELAAVTLDVYVCNFRGDHSSRAQTLLASLIELFAPGQVHRQALQRGALSHAPVQVAAS